MKQLALFIIRKQAKQPEPRIKSSTIKAYVRDKLQNFERRQQEREERRRKANDYYQRNLSRDIRRPNRRA
jgi:hypothetical protein